MIERTMLIQVFSILAMIFLGIGFATCVIAAATTIFLPIFSGGISGIISGLLFLAISRVLNYLDYSARRLQELVDLLNKQG